MKLKCAFRCTHASMLHFKMTRGKLRPVKMERATGRHSIALQAESSLQIHGLSEKPEAVRCRGPDVEPLVERMQTVSRVFSGHRGRQPSPRRIVIPGRRSER